MEACAVICSKATITVNASADMINFSTITLPDGNSCLHSANSCLPGPPSRPPEHKIEVFVRFCPSEPSISGFSSTKSRFLCAFGVWNPCFRAFRAQNRGFCALLPSETPIFGHFEHKNRLFVLFCPPEPPILGFPSTKSRFLCFFGLRNPHFRAFRAQNWHFCAREAGKAALGSLKISVYT